MVDCREALFRYAHTNLDWLKGPARRVVLEFQGLNRHQFLAQPTGPIELELSEAGCLFVVPYTAPWSWLNDGALAYVNQLVDDIFALLRLPQGTPIVSSGYSMGGQMALMYAQYARRPIAACYANSPVCDLNAHFSERDDVPRTLASAFIAHPGGVAAGMESRSPAARIDHFPLIPYCIVAGALDQDVAASRHGRPFAQRLISAGHHVIYRELPDMRHWQITDYAVQRLAVDFLKTAGGA